MILNLGAEKSHDARRAPSSRLADVKRLFLLRHAKSSWDDSILDDRDRPLAPRGQRAADAMGQHLARAGMAPDRVLCSPARRAIDTLAGIRPYLAPDLEVEVDEDLYEASAVGLHERILAVGDDVGTLLLVSHDPAISGLARALAGPEPSKAKRRLDRKFPTGACAEIHFATEHWREAAPGAGALRRFHRPRDLD